MSGGWMWSSQLWTAACAACASRPEEGHRTVLFIAVMVTLPFLVGGGAVAAIRALERRDLRDGSTSADPAAQPEQAR